MSLSAAKKRDILICCIAALLILCAMAARILGSPEGAPGLSSMIRNGIYMGLTAAWGVSVQRRIIQAQTRRYLIAIALLMLLWLTERAIKYEFNLSAASARRLWYSYYIPILLIPLITVFTAMSLGRPENYKLPGWTRLLYIPTFAFMAMVLTNDRHQLVFAFPADAGIWTGGNAAHSIGYFAVVAWTAVCAAGTIIVMIEKCRRPKSRIQWLPILPVALSFVYTALYVSDVKWLRLIAGDMTVFQCLAIMAALEGCIRCGLIQSNTGYDELFSATTIGAQITDHGFRVKSASCSALPISLEKMEQALEGPVQLDKNTLLKGQEISSGYVFWQEDISELQGVLDQFQTVQDELRDTGDVLKAEAEQRSYWLKITEENRLYDMVERKTQRQVALLRKLLSRLRATEDTEEARRLLGHIVVIGTYVKRRSNLMFVERQTGTLEAAELSLCLNESAAGLGLCNIKCTVRADMEGLLPAECGNMIYDFFEAAVEMSLTSLTSLLFYAGEREGTVTAKAALCCHEDMGALCCEFPNVIIEKDEDGIQYLTLSIPKEGGE